MIMDDNRNQIEGLNHFMGQMCPEGSAVAVLLAKDADGNVSAGCAHALSDLTHEEVAELIGYLVAVSRNLLAAYAHSQELSDQQLEMMASIIRARYAEGFDFMVDYGELG